MATDTSTKERNKINTKVKAPGLFNVIYVNDNTTTQQFVVSSLMQIFGHSEPSAMDLMTQVHAEGAAVVATLPYEIAEQKGVEVTLLARANGMPLMVKLEAE